MDNTLAMPATPDHSLSALDQIRLDSFSGGDPSLERVLLELYLQTADAYVDCLARTSHDPEIWHRTAHALRGASANIGAIRIAALAAAAEHAAPDAGLVSRLGTELDEVRGRVRALGNGMGNGSAARH